MLFATHMFAFQDELFNYFNLKIPKRFLPYVDPFTRHFTLPGFSFNLFKLCLKEDTLFGLNNEYGMQSSVGEKEVALYYDHAHPEQLVHSKYTTLKQKQCGRYSLDVFLEKDNIAIEYHSCVLMLHDDPKCTILKDCRRANNALRNPFGKSRYDIRREMEERDSYLVGECGIRHVRHIYECHWQRLKTMPLSRLRLEERAEAVAIRTFFDSSYDSDWPQERLAPRQAVKAGRTECFIHKLRNTDYVKPMEIVSHDFVSLYPSMGLLHNYPQGRYQSIVGRQLENVSITSDFKFTCLINGAEKEIHGFVQCKILPPQHLYLPYLPMRVKGKGNTYKSIFALCKTCADQMNVEPCEHEESDRCIVDVYTIIDVSYALSIGYKIMALYEILAFT